MPKDSFKVVANNITRFGGGFLKNVDKGMDNASKIMEKSLAKNIQETTYSLKDLARMGHPYARRHGAKGVQIHDPYYKVHKRSGDLLRSKFSKTTKATLTGGKLGASASVGLDSAKAEHAAAVVYGTSKMIPRPVVRGSVTQVEKEVVQKLRTKLSRFTVNFR